MGRRQETINIVPKLKARQKTLRWRIVATLLAVSILPLIVAGFGGWIVFGELLEQKAIEQMRILVRGHAKAIESNLSNRIHLLNLLAQSHAVDDIRNSQHLTDYLADLNQSSYGGFIDLGVIDVNGKHLAYVGPYQLEDKNYSETDWFKEVMVRGVFVSDVFLGFRQVPHCIIAVKSTREENPWILRATINSQQFDELVKTGVSEKINDAFIINKVGIYQTTPKGGSLLDTASLPIINFYHDANDQRINQNDTTWIMVNSFVNNNRWILVVKQELATVLEPVNQAIAKVAKIVIIAVALLIITTFLATWNLTNQIDKANAEREELSRAFIRSAKLASIGELATGLAHEINNPLAIISAEQTNILDLMSDININNDETRQIHDSVNRCKNQIQRCASITGKMLQFGRKREMNLEPTDITARLKEIVALLERHANVRNVEIIMKFQDNLPLALVDPIEFEQVVVNLINNAIDALPQGGQISLEAFQKDKCVLLNIIDNGIGIPPENMERIFEPFFTTKPVGKGTGLGLSVCFGIVSSWGGQIKVESVQDKGTTMRIFLPLHIGDGQAKRT
ncbi:MAG: ATP-binding protein [Candidatus Zixiibacteriota bacterium]